MRDIAALDVAELTMRINSYGGSVTDDIAIHNALKRHKAAVVTEVDGCAYSISSLIAQAGGKRRMASNALLMVHAPWGGVTGIEQAVIQPGNSSWKYNRNRYRFKRKSRSN